MSINCTTSLMLAGAGLLSVAAFTGFAQARTTRGSDDESRWRVAHNGGTAGGVQLLALSAVWERLAGESTFATIVAGSLALSTWLFFVGPLMKALGRTRTGNTLAWAGAVPSIPAYLGLIGLALGFGSQPL